MNEMFEIAREARLQRRSEARDLVREFAFQDRQTLATTVSEWLVQREPGLRDIKSGVPSSMDMDYRVFDMNGQRLLVGFLDPTRLATWRHVYEAACIQSQESCVESAIVSCGGFDQGVEEEAEASGVKLWGPDSVEMIYFGIAHEPDSHDPQISLF